MRQSDSAVWAFAASTLLPAVVVSVRTPLTDDLTVSSFIASLFVAFLFSLAANVLLGVPTFLIMRKLKWMRWWSAVAVGLVLGALLSVLIRFPSFDASDFLTIVPLTVLSTLTFWVIWKFQERSR